MEKDNKEWLYQIIRDQKKCSVKIEKLIRALDNKKFIDDIDREDIMYLKEQLCHMIRYAVILDERLVKAQKYKLSKIINETKLENIDVSDTETNS